MSSSKILFFLCISFVLGIFLESLFRIPQIFLWVFLFVGVIFVFVSLVSFWRKPESSEGTRKLRALWIPAFAGMTVAGFCFLFLIFGILRVQITEFNIANDYLSKFNGKGPVTFTGVINKEPDVRDTSQKLEVKIGGSLVLVTTSRYPEYNYLDKVKLTGKLEEPTVSDSFNYKNYLLKDGIYSVMGFPKIKKLEKSRGGPASTVYAGVLFLKSKLEQSIQDNFLPPHSLILEGIIFGNNKNMTQELRDKLNNTGLRFLTAISGVHVIIISAILIDFLIFLGLRRNRAFYLSIFLIWFYVILTGFTTSGFRAAIMGSIFIFAGALGRQNTSSRTIVLAAALMLLQNPLLLIYDVGFQLSFMACLGIIYLKPIVDYFLKFIFKENLKEFLDMASVTLTAQLFTLPIMIFNFGTVSLVAPITNILILPVMPAILSFGFLFSIFAAISKFLGWIFFIPTWALITYFLKIMDLFSPPWMAKTLPNVSLIWILALYAVIFLGTYLLHKKFRKDFL